MDDGQPPPVAPPEMGMQTELDKGDAMDIDQPVLEPPPPPTTTTTQEMEHEQPPAPAPFPPPAALPDIYPPVPSPAPIVQPLPVIESAPAPPVAPEPIPTPAPTLPLPVPTPTPAPAPVEQPLAPVPALPPIQLAAPTPQIVGPGTPSGLLFALQEATAGMAAPPPAMAAPPPAVDPIPALAPPPPPSLTTTLPGFGSTFGAPTALPPPPPPQPPALMLTPAATPAPPTTTTAPPFPSPLPTSTPQPLSSAGAPPTTEEADLTAPPSEDPTIRTLNVRDALTYLDQVKNEFNERADVYNSFLDIMKDFKSQNIDTALVIARVSELFRGHNQLIQGFNTFLPQGYRIETLDPLHPDRIIVTTPTGIITQNAGSPWQTSALAGSVGMGLGLGMGMGGAGGGGGGGLGLMPGGGPPQGNFPLPLPTQPAPMGHFFTPTGGTASVSPGPPPLGHPAHHQPPNAPPPQHAQLPHQQQLQHQQQPGLAPPTHPPTPAPPPDMPINHAMTYVNQIKVRFEHAPDKYKAFLDILQTYQQNRRPIADVYAQVHELFDGQADLIEEFQEFLPGKGRWGGNGIGELMAEGALAAQAAIDERRNAERVEREREREEREKREKKDRMREAQKARKKRPAPEREKEPVAQSSKAGGRGGVGAGAGQVGNGKRRARDAVLNEEKQPASKKQKHHHERSGRGAEMAQSPMPQSPRAHGHGHGQQQVLQQQAGPVVPPQPVQLTPTAFFERVKKHIDNKEAYAEFLKLLNLFTQGILDLRGLVERVRPFIAESRELWRAFCEVCGIEERDAAGLLRGEHGMEVRGREGAQLVHPLERTRVDLGRQKQYGPSYRKLPRSEINIECSGRDQLCWQVLNDTWVSHPTWSSEEVSFSTHKKNPYEEALHKSEEERHEFDYHIEAVVRTISILEPIYQRLQGLDAEDKAKFRLQQGLGGQNKGVYARVLKKIYGPDVGLEVLQALQDSPAVAVPVVLKRLKAKDEEWRRSQREWNKIWREIEARNYYKSLDHMGTSFKIDDKKKLTGKRMVDEIEAVKAEQEARHAMDGGAGAGRSGMYQLEYAIDDMEVLRDTMRLVMIFLDHATGIYSHDDRRRMEAFLRAWVPIMFGQDPVEFDAAFAARIVVEDSEEDVSPEGDGSVNVVAPPVAPPKANGHAKKGGARKKGRGGGRLPRNAAGSRAPSAQIPRSASPVRQDSGSGSGEVDVDMTVTAAERNAVPWIDIGLGEIGDEHDPQVDDGGQPVLTSSLRDEDPPARGRDVEMRDADVEIKAEAEEPVEPGQPALPPINGNVAPAPEPAVTNGFAPKPTNSGPRRVFFANQQFYVLFRFIHLMYSRLHLLKSHPEPAMLAPVNPLAVELGLVLAPSWTADSVTNGTSSTTATTADSSTGVPTLTPSHVYKQLLYECERLLGTEVEAVQFEEIVRALFGGAGYVIFTVPHVLAVIVKQIGSIQADEKCQSLYELFKEEAARQDVRDGNGVAPPQAAPQSKRNVSDVRAQIAYRRAAETIIGEENLYRLEWIRDPGLLRCAQVAREDPSADEPAGSKERWLAYVESYIIPLPTENLPPTPLQPSYLNRNLPERLRRKYLENNPSAPSSLPPLPRRFLAHSGLQCRVCIRTYRLFYVPRTEDSMFCNRQPRGQDEATQQEVAENREAWKNGKSQKMRHWLEDWGRKFKTA